MRLQKFLASCGVASRRAAELMILDGRVKVNGEVVSVLGAKVDPENDQVFLDRKHLKFENKKLFLFNKPKGVLSSLSDPHSKNDLQKYVVKTGVRAYPVGRLDKDAFGLMLLTNDGDFADKLLHPSYEIEREYYLLIEGRLSESSIKRAKSGVELDDGRVRAELKQISYSENISFIFDKPQEGYSLVSATLIEGRKHLVKRLLAKLGNPVKELCRYRHGPFKLNKLRPGQLEEIKSYSNLL